jgi:periplasmic protein CpxP/Spy
MNKARVAYCVAFLLVAMMSLSAMSQTESAPAQNQAPGTSGEQHERMDRMDHKRHMDDPQAHLDHMSRMLNLTDDQKAKIKPILEDSTKQMQQLRQDTSLSEQDRHAKMRSIKENTHTQIRQVLTPEQQAKMDEMQKQHEGMGKGKGMSDHDHNRPPAPPQ